MKRSSKAEAQRAFTLEDWYAFAGRGAVLEKGRRVRTTQKWTGDDDQHVGAVIGRKATPDYEVSEWLKAKGYTMHEVYVVKFDDIGKMVVWPEEIEEE